MDILVGILSLALIVQSVRAGYWKQQAKAAGDAARVQERLNGMLHNDALYWERMYKNEHRHKWPLGRDEWPDRIG